MGESRMIVEILCHNCEEYHSFDTERTGNCGLSFIYKCSSVGSIRTHHPIDDGKYESDYYSHKLTNGKYADPEQWYRFSKEEWGDYTVNTLGYYGESD